MTGLVRDQTGADPEAECERGRCQPAGRSDQPAGDTSVTARHLSAPTAASDCVRRCGCVEGERAARSRDGSVPAGARRIARPDQSTSAADSIPAHDDVGELRAVERERETQHVGPCALRLEAVLRRELFVRPLGAGDRHGG